MSSEESLRDERLKKYNLLKERGIDPFPGDPKQALSVRDVKSNFAKWMRVRKANILSGRVLAMRGHGGVIFFDLDDGTGKLQMVFKKDEVGQDAFLLFHDVVDIGDFLECKGTFFITKKKEKSLLVKEWRILAKALRPLPDKWHGLSDIEERFRKRYLDLISNEEIKKRFTLRSGILREIRNFLDKEEYLEVETPLLQPVPGGATAKPFKTHHNALGIDLYLRIAPELYLKELLIGGMNKVYELGRSFRNEGIDVTHNPEFTSIEVYTAYGTPDGERKKIESLFRHVVKKACGKYSFSYQGQAISVPTHFKIISFPTLMKQYALIGEREFSSRDDLALKAKQFGIPVLPHEGPERILDNIYKKVARPKLVEPTFIIDYPEASAPLAKHHPTKKGFIDRFQLIVAGVELVNGFAELNDPIEQERRFLEQEKKRRQGDDEAHIKDEAYIEAMEYGMPPATGWAIGIDRLVMLLTDTANIREVLLFPTLRPKE